VLWKPRLKKSKTNTKKGDYTCLHFLFRVLSDQLYICSCALYTGLLFRWCESTAAIARVSEDYLVSHCTMERREDGLPANRARNRGQRGRNPPWFCDCLRNARLRVLRQNQRRVAQRVETILVLLVLGLIWLVARPTAEPLSSRSRELFAVSLDTHSYSHKRKQLTSNKLAFSSGENCNARLWEAMLTRANGALRDAERLTRLGCALQVNNTRLRLVRRLTSAVRGSLVLAHELRHPREVVSAHVPPHEIKRRKKRIYRRSGLSVSSNTTVIQITSNTISSIYCLLRSSIISYSIPE